MDETDSISKRHFLAMIGRLGGAGAMYRAMGALGFVASTDGWAGPIRIENGAGKGKTVAILGAGIGGLTTAYELSRAGYRCVILEALDRAGGRNHTARRGSVVEEESAEHGRTKQVAQLDEGLYLNLGPGRLPFHHRRILHYCQELGVKLEVYIMSATANLFQSDAAFDGKPMPRFRLTTDLNTHVSELLSKAINRNALDDELRPEDRPRLLELLRSFGDLPAVAGSGATSGGDTPRTGCIAPTTIEAICRANPTLPLRSLLDSRLWDHHYFQTLESEWQPTLFQPVGGMDRIVDGFKRKVGRLIRYRCEVTGLTTAPDGVTVQYLNHRTGATESMHADYCVSNIPIKHLKRVRANFSDEYRAALDQYRGDALYKLGWQANSRFWEKSPNDIFGGISYTDDPITQIWYPSYDYFSAKGTLTGIYTYKEQAVAFGKMSLQDRVVAARRGAVKLHAEFGSEAIVPSAKAISVAWQNALFQGEGSSDWRPENPADQRAYKRLLAPDGRFFLIGDQVSPYPGWQEGAIISAEHAMAQITGQRSTAVAMFESAPDSRQMLMDLV